jgi:type IX secretion system PorP/SprF family membrane protein
MKQQITFFFLSLGLIANTNISAQSDISMATHWYNRANYNPASIARTDYLYLFSNARQQWQGVSGAPKIFNMQASEYIHDLRSAFGLSQVSDQVGLTKACNPMLTYAYRVARDPDWSLAIGMSAGMFIRSINGSQFESVTDNDPAIDYSMTKSTRPDANIGSEFQNNHFIISISSTHLFSIGKSDNLFLNTNHRYGSVKYKNSDHLLFNYDIGLQLTNRYNLTAMDINTSVRFKRPTGLMKGPNEFFDLGLTYSTTRQLTFLFGLNISPNCKVGYAYTQSFISGYYLSTTHEMMIEYRFLSKAASTRFRCGDNLFWYH